MATTLNFWTIVALIPGLLLLLPSIMGFFSKNKFNVSGKVRFPSQASRSSSDEMM
jgi:hypothetical protein